MKRSPGVAALQPGVRRPVLRVVPVVMLVVAASLAVASGIHLLGHVTGRGSLYDPTDAGIAEAVIGVVLVVAAVAMLRYPHRARSAGLGAVGLAIAGFLVGITITAQSGHLPDIAYHVAVLPVLIASFVALLKAPSPA